MKRIILFIPLAFLALSAFAQSRAAPATVTVSGTLEAVNARIAVKSAGQTYYVLGIDRLIGFVAGLNEGAPVTLEGYEGPAPAGPADAGSEYRILFASKLSFNGKDYDLGPRPGAFPDRDRSLPGQPPYGNGRRDGNRWGCRGHR
jgi:hypothetical protein